MQMKQQKQKMNPSPSVNRSELASAQDPVRLQKILADSGVGSRRACEQFIIDGRIRVNGIKVTTPGSRAIPEKDEITFDGKVISVPQKVVYVFNKPRNVITSMVDPEGRPCVGDYLRDLPYRLYPVGRLDYDVSGLIVLTNDGNYANRLMHPRYGVRRTYIARVKNTLDEKKCSILQRGIQLRDGFARVHSVKNISPDKRTKALLGDPKTNESLIEISVTEGRKHFVKNILEAVHCPVEKLSRIAFGPYTLRGIPSGTLRQISHKEELFG
jgi:23S rRNA pseudouridine2605 synthase